jgi:hypothetical protein
MATPPAVAWRQAHAAWRAATTNPQHQPAIRVLVLAATAIPVLMLLGLWWGVVTMWYTAAFLIAGFSRIAEYRESRRDSRRARLSHRQHRESLAGASPSPGVPLSSERIVIESVMSYTGAAKRLVAWWRMLADHQTAATLIWIVGYPFVVPVAFLINLFT